MARSNTPKTYDTSRTDTSRSFYSGDLNRQSPRMHLGALWIMMTVWGRDPGAQERYRRAKQPRWPSGHRYDDACFIRGCYLCREKFLDEHIDSLPAAAREVHGI